MNLWMLMPLSVLMTIWLFICVAAWIALDDSDADMPFRVGVVLALIFVVASVLVCMVALG